MKILSNITLTGILLFSAAGILAQQGAEIQKGIELYNKGEFKQAAELLEKGVKAAPDNAGAQAFLGMAQIKLGKFKDAEKTLGKSLALNPDQPVVRKALAYVYLLRGKPEDSIRQIDALRAAAPIDAEAFYILGLANLRLGNTDLGLENADQAVRLNPKYANAYLLKAQVLMDTWDDSKKDYAALAKKYGSSPENINKFIQLSAETPDALFWRGQQENLKVFADYFAEKEKNKNSANADIVTPIKVLKKPGANYSDRALQAGVQGTIRLLVAFPENGKVSNILVLTSLGYGLDEEVIKAARKIKYEPQKRNGKPVMTIKPVEYIFSIG
jgi:TonB family protein